MRTMLRDPLLLETRAFVAGAWIEPAHSFSVCNPATGGLLAMVGDCDVPIVRQAIESAEIARHAWATRTGKERAEILLRWHGLIVENADDLAAILTAEMGKPLAEAKGEILYGASYVQWFAEEAKRIYGDIIPGHQRDKRIFVLKQPIGVVAGITPWNFPHAMVTRKVAPALAAGCSFVLRPSELTPLSALSLAVLAERAGIPPGIFSVVPSLDATASGQELCLNPKVAKISFTGSTRVGRILMAQSAETIKKLSLELGGNAPFIVFDDADLDTAVAGALAAKYRNNGQTCVCANRIYVQSGIYEDFARRLSEEVARLTLGDGFEPGVTLGPMINEAAVAKIEAHIADARQKGATVLCGGHRSNLGGTFFLPTVLSDVTQAMQVAREETFGPLAPLFRFDTEAEVVAMANDTEYGLASYFFSQDVARVWRVAERLDYGMVGVNTGMISTEVAPFGGVKQSGLGREGSKYGIDDYLEIKNVTIGGMG